MNSVVVSVMLLIVCVSVLIGMLAHVEDVLSNSVEILLDIGVDLACLWWLCAVIFNWERLLPLFFVSSLCIFLSGFYLIGRFFFERSLSRVQIFRTITTSIIAIVGTIGLLATTYIP
jgi:hypothetical protein